MAGETGDGSGAAAPQSLPPEMAVPPLDINASQCQDLPAPDAAAAAATGESSQQQDAVDLTMNDIADKCIADSDEADDDDDDDDFCIIAGD